MEKIFSDEKQKAIAAANLSQLEYFVHPISGNTFVSLPDATYQRIVVMASLETIGFNLKDASLNREISIDGQHDQPAEVARNGDLLIISKEGLQRLIDAGVKTLTLIASKDKSSNLDPSHFQKG